MMSKSFAIEVNYLYFNQNNRLFKRMNGLNENQTTDENEWISRQLKRELKKTFDEVIDSVTLEPMSFTERPQNLRTYYEEKCLHRYKGFIEFTTSSRDLIKKCLTKICSNDVLEKTQISFNSVEKSSNLIHFLSNINQLITRQELRVHSFAFGSVVDLTDFVEHYSSEMSGKMNVAKDDITADFKHDMKRLDLKFRLTSGGKGGKLLKNVRYKLELNYKAINSAVFSITESDNKTKVMRIYFNLNQPTLLFKLAIDDLSAEEERRFIFTQCYDKSRPHYKQLKSYKMSETDRGVHIDEVQSHHKWIRERDFFGCDYTTIGKSNVLMIEIPLIINESKLDCRDNDIPDPYRVLYLIQRFSKIPISLACIERHEGMDFNNNKIKTEIIDKILPQVPSDMRFQVIYAFHSVFSHTFQSSDELFLKKQTENVVKIVTQFCETEFSESKKCKIIAETLFGVSELMDRNVIFCLINALKHIYWELRTVHDRAKVKGRENRVCVDIEIDKIEIEFIRRCILTPTRLLFLPPQPTLRSRFIVNSDPDYTIRLSVREDDLQTLQYSMGHQNSSHTPFLNKVVKQQLKNGIKIGDRLFEFLGSSSSQLRDTGMVLYAKDKKERTAESIRESIGDMRLIRKNVAKYVARLGLAFSQVMTHIPIDKEVTEVDEDIEHGIKLNERMEKTEELYNFSDGVGRVSMKIMERVYERLKADCRDRPSAMQIRYGGCKGMLVIDPSLKGERIIFRKSMKKYESNVKYLGIIKLSAPRPLYLNRPFITILDQLGVESKVFLKMLMNDLKNLANSMVCECSATPLLQNSSTLGIPYRRLYKTGIPFLNEQIFKEIINSVINHRMDELILKARIKIPMTSGRTVFGVLDETASLEYGEVFVQITDVDEDNRPLHTTTILDSKTMGDIMVTKFPCLHPGDVRKLKAVNIPALKHIKDCIVFPQKGRRPHPDEMAGSDLDGDEYAVIWNSPLIFEIPNEDPMIFPTSDPTLLEKDATVEDVLDFYCEFIIASNVGLLASAHLAQADREREGIFSDVCKSLAHKYAVGLDFAKTGRVEKIEWNERARMYPDFMQKFKEKRSYLSPKILGQLYRHCDRFRLGIDTKNDITIKASANPNLIVEGWQQFEESALKAYEEYKRKVTYLLNRFGVDSEAILLSGAFSKGTKYMTGRTETNDVHELLENMINKLFKEFKKRFENECKNDLSENELKRRQRASAWYMIPYKDESQQRYFGFSWTITEDICLIMKDKKFCVNKVDHNCLQLSTDLIDDFFENNFIYKEPELDDSVTESDRRQMTMERRCESAEVVLRAWLERQDHLFWKRKIAKKLISSTDCVMSDMDKKLRRKLSQTRLKLMSEAKDSNKTLKTAGNLVMDFLKESMDEWLDIQSLDRNNRIVDTPLVKFGFSALITLSHFFKTREISHIIHLGPTFKVALSAPIRDDTFFVHLPSLMNRGRNGSQIDVNDDKFRKYVEYMVQKPEEFVKRLERISGAIEICLEPYSYSTRTLQYYYLLTATGTVWSLQTIKNIICHPTFFRDVANTDKGLIRRNLFCKGMPDFRTIPTS